MIYLYLMVHDLACIVGAVYLVSIDYPWWAGLFALLAATTTVKNTK